MLDIADCSDPFSLFIAWMKDAERCEINDPNAMALATVDEAGLPNMRMVLLKNFDDRGFVFYTNCESAKGRELLAQRKASCLFHWKSLRRQVRVRGGVSPVDDVEADIYFSSRARDSQIGAWASQQSRPLESRSRLERDVEIFSARYGAAVVPRPPHWSGFRILPLEIEFWIERPFRLHDRFVFRRPSYADGWSVSRLYP